MSSNIRKLEIRISRQRAGFSFIEVLFAVVLLGIGFIMIAGVFPVAIEQTAITANETQGTLVARDAIRQIQSIASQPGASALFPAAATVTPLAINPTLASDIGVNGFFSSDRRFGWVGFYLRNGTDPFVQVYIIALQNPAFQDPGYIFAGLPPIIPSTNYIANSTATFPVPVTPSPIAAQFAYSPLTGSSYVYLQNATIGSPTASPAPADPVPNATTGSYVLVADNAGGPTIAGRIYRLGPEVSIAATGSTIPAPALPPDVVPTFPGGTAPIDVYQLEPGLDLKPGATPAAGSPEQSTASPGSRVYIIGRSPAPAPNSTNANQANFAGPNQDIAVMSAIIRLNTADN